MTSSALPLSQTAELRGTVLVVDDDIGVQDTLCDILQLNGIDASAVGSAAEATAWCDQHSPDLVVLDQRLPDSSGLQLAALLKADAPLVPVVLLTGYVSTETAIAAVGLVDDFLSKPVPPGEFVKVVQTRLEQYRLRLANQDLLAQLREANNRLEHTVEERTKELLAARDQAMEASRLKSQFLANMSHEIRTPLNGVIGVAELLGTTQLSDEQRDYVGILTGSSQSLLAVINDVLDFSKIEAGRLELTTSAFPLREPFADVVAMLKPQATGKGLALDLSIDDDVPQVAVGDAARLRQVVTNLVGNAVKFTDAGRVSLDVQVTAREADVVTVRCAVSDTGIGISASDIPLLFHDFTQIDPSNTRRFGGTGLGLAISDRLVRLMGGAIGCTPNREAGSTFWFTVPFQVPAQQPGTAGTSPSLAADAERSSDDPLMLIVEDNQVNATILSRMLALLGYHSEVVRNGADALDAVAHATYAAIFMDCQMPVMDGFATTRELRRRFPDVPRVPVIAITATATTEDQARCLEAGMDDYLPKPIVLERLSETVQRWAPLDRP